MEKIRVLLLGLVVCFGLSSACGIEDPPPSTPEISKTSAALTDGTFWTGSTISLKTAPFNQCVAQPTKELQFRKMRFLFGSTYYDYATSDSWGRNAPGGAVGPFFPPSQPTNLAQTLYCSATLGGSIGIQTAYVPFTNFKYNTQAMSCGLMSYWPNGNLSTAHLTIAVGGMLVYPAANPGQPNGYTTYHLVGPRDDSTAWCGDATLGVEF